MSTTFTSTPIKTLYFLLYAKYGNSSAASSDENQFKYQVFSTIFKYGPAWLKRLQIQEKLFNIDLEGKDLLEGTTQIYSHAENPDTAVGASDTQFTLLKGTSNQNVTATKRGKLEGYSALQNLMETDVTEEFLGKFKKFFLKVVAPQEPLWYSEVGDRDIDSLLHVNSTYGNYRTNTFQEIWPSYEDFESDYEDSGIPTTI